MYICQYYDYNDKYNIYNNVNKDYLSLLVDKNLLGVEIIDPDTEEYKHVFLSADKVRELARELFEMADILDPDPL